MKRISFLLLLALCVTAVQSATITITDDSIPAGASRTWTADNVYVLSGFVFVESGSRLTIEAGTVVKANAGTGASASALIICRGGKIYARGRVDKPIIFTALADDPANPALVGFDPSTTKGLWGGLIICGRAPNNINGQVMQVEGVPATYGSLINYGDSANAIDQTTGAFTDSTSRNRNSNDTSGVLQYVSIRHPGSVLDANKEINGLTLCSVGKGTTIDHVEIFNSADDGVEWFGGTVDCKYLVSAYSDDDAFDYDQGYTGKAQFLFAIQNSENGRANRLGEFDSDDGASVTSNAGALPLAKPVWYNCTFIGSGKTSANTLNDYALIYKENGGGTLANSIVYDFRGQGVRIEDKAGTAVDARTRFASGDISLKNNLFYNIVTNDSTGLSGDSTWVRDTLLANGNRVADPLLVGVSRDTLEDLDPRPANGSPALSSLASLPSGNTFFKQVSYRGAFDPNDLWIRGWTLLSSAKYLPARGMFVVDIWNDSVTAGQSKTWTSNNEYVLNGFVFVESGATLTIEPGTVIRGRDGTGSSASALIVCRGGKLIAQGTSTAPIIFTALADDIDDPSAVGFDPTTTKGLWGGLIICGKAPNNINGQVMQAEGVPTEYGSLINYGDSANTVNQTTQAPDNAAAHLANTHDTSGILRYVSIRYAGSVLAANKEINGLTLCSVGKGTIIDHVEIFNSADDGIEWFGGTVDCKYLISAFADDDAFDYDQGYTGKAQFLFAIQNSENGRANRLGEFDSDDGASITSNAGTLPLAKPVWYNGTFIGSGKTSANTLNDYALIYKENAGGTLVNSIVYDFRGQGVRIEDKAGTAVDARTRFASGDISLKNNLFYNIITNDSTGLSGDSTWVRDTLLAHANAVADPLLRGISRTNNGGLIPQPAAGSPAFSNVATVPADAFFSAADYRGAFGNDNWAEGWTLLDDAGFFGGFNAVGIVRTAGIHSAKLALSHTVVRGSTLLEISVPARSHASLALFDMSGRQIAVVLNKTVEAGRYKVNLADHRLGNKMYIVKLTVDGRTLTDRVAFTR